MREKLEASADQTTPSPGVCKPQKNGGGSVHCRHRNLYLSLQVYILVSKKSSAADGKIENEKTGCYNVKKALMIGGT